MKREINFSHTTHTIGKMRFTPQGLGAYSTIATRTTCRPIGSLLSKPIYWRDTAYLVCQVLEWEVINSHPQSEAVR